jgi:pimeloyl-ACP methyl ester carboxylesterase/cytochrome c556
MLEPSFRRASFSRRAWAAGACLLLIAGGGIRAHDYAGARSEELAIDAPFALVGATALVPIDAAGGPPIPCVVLAGGSLSQDRDGRLFREGAPKRDALRRLAEALAVGGYSSIRYDRVGYGASKAKEGWTGSYEDESKVLAAVIAHARKRPGVASVAVAGESAGAYLACLAARDGAPADAYVFLGAHCGPGKEIYAYNFRRLVEHVERYPENLAWAKELRMELALGRGYEAMFQAAAEGRSSFELVDGEFRASVDLARRREELRWPPDEAFRHIRAPVLALAGERDLNVAPGHAERIAAVLRRSGNERVEAVLIPDADHSFQASAESEHARMRERFTLESFRRPYQPRAYREIIRWLRAAAPTPLEAHLELLDAIAARADEPPKAEALAADAPVTTPRTENAPERIHLAPGVELIDDITRRESTAGVWTLEGRIGPLILGEGSQAHFIEMPAGLYVEEHPHSSESLIFTARGRWVLVSRGRRHLMREGSLFRFGAGVPTGYEVPFAENAFILIFKGDRLTRDEKEFIDYLRGMAARLAKERREGVPYRLGDLPREHPARVFALEVNPRFDPAAAPSAAAPLKLPSPPGIENLLCASARVFSGGEPRGEEAFLALARMGIKTVVSVDGARPDVEAARKHGLRYVHVPIGYNDIGAKARGALARVAREAEGPIYVHCHHGVHRGPAAAAVICLSEAGADTALALELLEAAGTGKQYRGLWRAVEEYRPPADGEPLPALEEVAKVDSLAAAMAAIDRSFDNLKLVAKAAWRTPADHPDIEPRQEALILRQGFQEALRTLDERDARFRTWLDESLEAARALEESLAQGRADEAGRRFESLGATCTRCHEAYRQ